MSGLDAADLTALRALSETYAAATDDRDAAAVGELFIPEGVLVVPEPPAHLDPHVSHVGRAAVVATFGALAGTLATTHVVAGARYLPTAAGARGRVRGTAHHVLPARDGPSDLVWFLHYDDEYARTDEGWAFTRRALTINWIERHRVSVVRADEEGTGR
ncbi:MULTISPECIES: nuclear transport factor 2 family protein [unclassified Micromonospora]|uniref:nuclear transport factor 2 family protein n=1 Tax=unclassified Micromonospora TaxID=2617518 RepID=UPI001B365F8D|nr:MULTISPECIES: nuclear transport factor 2 family protein [unclassified Micromonospora]MBQ1040943.1 nuclear transport factor 2 family protein [Micromonospora sp. C72]MBQ1055251.1 nuclear transport factor 2 family protein [Micromonospora sp. C32]